MKKWLTSAEQAPNNRRRRSTGRRIFNQLCRRTKQRPPQAEPTSTTLHGSKS